MSIFSGLSLQSIGAVIEAAKSSPEGLAALGIVALVVVLALGMAAALISHHVGGFYARIEEEDAQAAPEEQAGEARKTEP